MLRIGVLVLLLALASSSDAWSRAWSYHYNPAPVKTSTPTPVSSSEATPVTAPHSSTAQLLKETIVSDLAARVRRANVAGEATSTSDTESRRIISLLATFDKMDSTDDLRVLTELSDYYLGKDAEAVYDCVLLRKGSTLTPYIKQAIDQASTDCVRKLGASFGNPSQALGGHALCVTSFERNAHLNLLAAEIDAGKSCSDGQLIALVRETSPSSPNEP